MKNIISSLLFVFSFQAHADALDQQLKAVNSFFGLKNGHNQNIQLRGTVGNVCLVNVTNNTQIDPGSVSSTRSARHVRVSILLPDSRIASFKLGMWSEKVSFRKSSEEKLTVSSANRENPAGYPLAITLNLEKIDRNTLSVQIVENATGRSSICVVNR